MSSSGGIGLGRMKPAPPAVPISAGFWASGGAWDLAGIAGANGANFTAAVAALAGAGAFTPAASGSTINDTAIGGKRGLQLDRTLPQWLENDALAAIINGANKTWTLGFDNRKFLTQSTNTVVSFGATTLGSTRDYVNAVVNINSQFELDEHSLTHGATSYTTVQQNQYDDTYYLATWDGATGVVYINGAVVAVTPSAYDTAAMIINRVGWGADMAGSGGFTGVDGFIRRLQVSSLVATPTQAAQWYLDMLANNYTLPASNPLVPTVLTAGNSIMQAPGDSVTGGGWRFYSLANLINLNKLSWQTLGPFQGQFENCQTASSGGATEGQIAAQVAANALPSTGLLFMGMGQASINTGNTAAAVLATILTQLNAARTSLYAQNPKANIVFPNICPYAEAGFNTVAQAVNAGLAGPGGVWAQSDAAFPGKPPVVGVDVNTAMGGPAYNPAFYAHTGPLGDDHPNALGYQQSTPVLSAGILPILQALSPT